MKRKLTTDQKKEYLHLLLAGNTQAAKDYLNTLRPLRMIFKSQEELREYEREIGEPVTWFCIIIKDMEPAENK